MYDTDSLCIPPFLQSPTMGIFIHKSQTSKTSRRPPQAQPMDTTARLVI